MRSGPRWIREFRRPDQPIRPGAAGLVAELPLDRVNPFRLIGIFPASQTVVEWRWNLWRVERVAHCWRTNTWISSGFDEPGAQQTRGKTFGEALLQSPVGGSNRLRRLHRSHAPERGPYSTCMHRPDASTVSFSWIRVTATEVNFFYSPAPPCKFEPGVTVTLPRRSRCC